MLKEYIYEHYKEAEPIFFSDLESLCATKPALSQQLKRLCNKGLLVKYDTGVYFIPKITKLNSVVGPSADVVAKYRFISKCDDIVDGFYSGNTFANRLGISMQVPQIIEIVSNNSSSSDREVIIGGRRFYIRRSKIKITKANVAVLQMLDILKNLDTYLDYSYRTAKERFYDYIRVNNIRRRDVDMYIREFPLSTFRYYFELELDSVLT